VARIRQASVARDDFYGNGLRSASGPGSASKKIGKPTDKTEWGMNSLPPSTPLQPAEQHHQLPAGILQPPFFDPSATNYGGAGAVIGHEMTHGFDDQGCKFDGDGNLRLVDCRRWRRVRQARCLHANEYSARRR
jgi:predicted metalloendopeptidase